jgi:CheY-like chemotaxis protein
LCPQTEGESVQAVAASVLTVEDDPIVQADLRLVLEDAGFTVVGGARDGEEAVELARRHEPDVILLDLGLPRPDGIEVTRRILSEREVPIVALTGRSRALAEEAIDAGAASYLLKPVASRAIVGALVDALQPERLAHHARATSRQAIETMLDLLGHPDEWAVELEQRAWDGGHVWRIVD